jgi:hypothetical protein
VWAGQYGRAIPGNTCGEQLAAVRAWNATAWTQTSTVSRRALAFGVYTPSAIEEAVGCRAGKPQWRGRLAAAMAQAFTDGKWVLMWLAPRRTGPKSRNE